MAASQTLSWHDVQRVHSVLTAIMAMIVTSSFIICQLGMACQSLVVSLIFDIISMMIWYIL